MLSRLVARNIIMMRNAKTFLADERLPSNAKLSSICHVRSQDIVLWVQYDHWLRFMLKKGNQRTHLWAIPTSQFIWIAHFIGGTGFASKRILQTFDLL